MYNFSTIYNIFGFVNDNFRWGSDFGSKALEEILYCEAYQDYYAKFLGIDRVDDLLIDQEVFGRLTNFFGA